MKRLEVNNRWQFADSRDTRRTAKLQEFVRTRGHYWLINGVYTELNDHWGAKNVLTRESVEFPDDYTTLDQPFDLTLHTGLYLTPENTIVEIYEIKDKSYELRVVGRIKASWWFGVPTLDCSFVPYFVNLELLPLSKVATWEKLQTTAGTSRSHSRTMWGFSKCFFSLLSPPKFYSNSTSGPNFTFDLLSKEQLLSRVTERTSREYALNQPRRVFQGGYSVTGEKPTRTILYGGRVVANEVRGVWTRE